MLDPGSTLAAMLDNPMASPYPHQEAVCEHLLTGRNVILQAPTGSGKTEAALLPFLHAFKYRIAFPRKCIYAVPLRALANQFKARAKGWLEHLDLPLQGTIQTGEHPDDRKLEGDLVFATIDQALSSALMRPYSLSRSQANLNLGTIAGSYLVLDEVHLFDKDSTFPTSLILLKMLQGVSPFVLMTATLSCEMLRQIANFLDASVIAVGEGESDSSRSLPSQSRTRKLQWRGEPLTAEAVAKRHEGKRRSLVVCNTVDRAVGIYSDLCTQLKGQNVQLTLLHSRFRQEDRARKESELIQLFGKDADRESGSAIAIATQVVEVGLDISCETLHTELAPANSLVQRAGRCARYVGQTGDLFIYDIDSLGPYRQQRDLIDFTREAVSLLSNSNLDIVAEQNLLDQVHLDNDRRAMENGFLPTWVNHRNAMYGVMEGRDSAAALVRAIDSRLLLIHPDGQEVAAAPFAYEGFGLHPGVIRQHLDSWLAKSCQLDLEWAVLGIREYPESDRDGPLFQPFPVRCSDDLRGVAVIVINPALAGYDPELGLLLDEANGYVCPLRGREDREQLLRRYRAETYQEHVQATYQCFQQRVWPKIEEAAARLEQAYGWSAGAMHRACALAALLHDTGKLSQGWQAVARKYMDIVGFPQSDRVFWAHTEYDSRQDVHRQAQTKAGRRPPHAAEGACLAMPVLHEFLSAETGLVKATLSAIARHHGAFTNSSADVSLCTGAVDEVRASLALVEPELRVADKSLSLMQRVGEIPDLMSQGLLTRADNNREFLAYSLIVRALRLSDQMGTAMHSVGGNLDAVG